MKSSIAPLMSIDFSVAPSLLRSNGDFFQTMSTRKDLLALSSQIHPNRHPLNMPKEFTMSKIIATLVASLFAASAFAATPAAPAAPAVATTASAHADAAAPKEKKVHKTSKKASDAKVAKAAEPATAAVPASK